MRLLHTTEWKFEDFFDSEIPRYAILSHRWGRHEISYQELLLAIKGRKTSTKLRLQGDGYTKIEKCREQAAQDNYEWVWIDTCCINRESSTDLSEAINSMYSWYGHAEVCYIYLADVEDASALECFEVEDEDEQDGHICDSVQLALESFRNSNWFTRGWTLQELLAPDNAVFYDRYWRRIANRSALAEIIESVTAIEFEFLRGKNRQDLIASASMARRMSWIARRTTSRSENIAYCILGLFDVNMSPSYGEGKKAFMRLKLEIIKKSEDDSIFAWDLKPDGCSHIHFHDTGMLALEPSLFAGSRYVEWHLSKNF